MNCTELQALAAARALGILDPADQARLDAVLAENGEARADLAAFANTVAVIAAALVKPAMPSASLKTGILEQQVEGRVTSGVMPAASLRAAILERIAQTPQLLPSAPPTPVPAGFRIVLEGESGWTPGPIPGTRIKPLSLSRDMGYHVLLAEIAPGTTFPEHDHASSEDLFIVSGHLQTEGRLLGPGDFLHAEPGTHHHPLMSPDGCVALLIERAPVAA